MRVLCLSMVAFLIGCTGHSDVNLPPGYLEAVASGRYGYGIAQSSGTMSGGYVGGGTSVTVDGEEANWTGNGCNMAGWGNVCTGESYWDKLGQ